MAAPLDRELTVVIVEPGELGKAVDAAPHAIVLFSGSRFDAQVPPWKISDA
jgi:hypothetical protein